MDNAICGVKEQILVEVNKKIAVLEAKLESKMNETHQTTATTLQGINEIVAALRDSQQKMWRVIECMSNELQELIPGDATRDVPL